MYWKVVDYYLFIIFSVYFFYVFYLMFFYYYYYYYYYEREREREKKKREIVLFSKLVIFSFICGEDGNGIIFLLSFFLSLSITVLFPDLLCHLYIFLNFLQMDKCNCIYLFIYLFICLCCNNRERER